MKRRKLLWIPLLFIVSIAMVDIVEAQIHTKLYVNPENSTACVDETFVVNVNVLNVTNLYGFEFKLFYDTSVLDGVSVELPLGHFLTPVDPTKIFIAALEIDDGYNATHGRVLASALLLRPEQTRNGSGTLVSIAFNATAPGSTTLDLRDTKLGDPDGQPLAHEAVDGHSEVSEIYTRLYVNPENSTACVDETFVVNVNVLNVTNLYGFEFKLFYDTSVLDGVSVELPLGHFLTPVDPTKIFIAALEIDDGYNATHGRVLACALLLRPEQTRNGSGTLVSIAFNATAPGSTTLDLRDTKLGDPDGQPLAHETVDGYFTGLSTPAASFTISPDPPYCATQPLTFNATASYDPDGTIDSYQWDFGDGNVTTVTDPTITHAYTSIGDYTVTLTVTDNDNLTDTASADVTILLHDIAVTSVKALPLKVNVGESVSINVTVANEGDFSETFNVTVYYNGNILDTQTDITLSAGANATLTFSWNTTNVSAGNYTIKADASAVPNETETINNTYTNGIVEVREVKEAPTTPLVVYVAAAIVIVIIVAAIVVYLVRFRKS